MRSEQTQTLAGRFHETINQTNTNGGVSERDIKCSGTV